MRVAVYINPLFDHHEEWLGAFVQGLLKNGIKAVVMRKDIPIDCDLAVMWSHGPSWSHVIADRQSKGLNYLVLDRGYMGDRFQNASFSLNGIHGASDHSYSKNVTPEAAEEHKDLFKKWNPGKKYVLLMGQVPGDSSLQGVDIIAWLRAKTAELQDAGYDVVYRPHPKMPMHVSITRQFMTADLNECFKHALCVYTYSSTSGVDAMLAGKPVIAESPVSMVYDIAGHCVDDIKGYKKPEKRALWFNEIAHYQWSLKLIEEGVAFKYLLDNCFG